MKRLLGLLMLLGVLTACGSSRAGYPCSVGESPAVTGCTGRGSQSSAPTGASAVAPAESR